MTIKLKPTSLETQYGRPIYENTETGEKHSELSTTFKYKGKWINIPTLHKGKIYTADQLKRFLDLDDSALDGWITSTHESKFEAEEAAKNRSTSLKHTAAKTTNANFQLSSEGMALISKDPGYINRDAIKTKNDKKLTENGKLSLDELSSLTSTTEDRKFVSDLWDEITSGLDSKVKSSNLKEASLLTDLKDVKPNWGEIPGFKFNHAKGQGPKQGYWDADETSGFWQTDAGYDKAMQTWGEKPGWVKPGYRPKRKELDIEAIKSWFKPSK